MGGRKRRDDGLRHIVVQPVIREYGGYEVRRPAFFLLELLPQLCDLRRDLCKVPVAVGADHLSDVLEAVFHIGQYPYQPPAVRSVVDVFQPRQEQLALPRGHYLHVSLKERVHSSCTRLVVHGAAHAAGPADHRDVAVSGPSCPFVVVYGVVAGNIVYDPGDRLLLLVGRGHFHEPHVGVGPDRIVARLELRHRFRVEGDDLILGPRQTQNFERNVDDLLGAAIVPVQRQPGRRRYPERYAFGVVVEIGAHGYGPIFEINYVVDGYEPEPVDALLPIAYHAEVGLLQEHQCDHHLVLVGVLELVDHDVPAGHAPPDACVAVKYDECEHRVQAVGEPVVRHRTAQVFVVDVMDQPQELGPVVVGRRSEDIGRYDVIQFKRREVRRYLSIFVLAVYPLYQVIFLFSFSGDLVQVRQGREYRVGIAQQVLPVSASEPSPAERYDAFGHQLVDQNVHLGGQGAGDDGYIAVIVPAVRIEAVEEAVEIFFVEGLVLDERCAPGQFLAETQEVAHGFGGFFDYRVAERVERSGLDEPGVFSRLRIRKPLPDAFLHLGGRVPGERQKEDVLRLHVRFFQDVDVPAHDGEGLARARSGVHHVEAVQPFCYGLLRCVRLLSHRIPPLP